jgi:hypothetical protein
MKSRQFFLSSHWIRSFAATAVIGCSILSIGCSATEPLARGGQMPVKIVKIGDDAPVEGSFQGTAIFGAIPGTIFGSPQAPYTTAEADTISGLAFNLDQLSDFRGQATALTPKAVSSGLVVTPANTRLLRVSTGFEISDVREQRSFVGFADSDPKHTLILAYFDQPCRVTGTILTPPRIGEATKHRFDITIQKSGFHWLSISSKDANNLTVIRQASGSVKPIFVVKLVSLGRST